MNGRKVGIAVVVAVCLTLGLGLARRAQTVMLPVDQKVVVLDPGHGGWDPGRTGIAGDNEKDVNLAVALLVQGYLEEAGAVVILTRNTDEALSLKKKEDMSKRAEVVAEAEGDILVSIHQNSYPSPGVRGAQTFYFKGDVEGERLAKCLQSRLIAELDPQNHRLAKANGDYYILKTSENPAAIVECGFLTDPQEEALLNDPAYRERVAWAIYLGILDYFSPED